MTDQNQNPSDRNDPNRPAGAPAWPGGPEDVANASGAQFPTGQPGEYAAPDAARRGGQFGQPGEYERPAGQAPDPHVGQGQPGEYSAGQYPGGAPTTSGAESSWPAHHQPGGYGNGQYGSAPNATGPYPDGAYPSGQYPTGQYPSGQYPTGQYASGQFPNGQHDSSQTGPFGPPPTGQYAPGAREQAPFDQSTLTEQPRRQPRPRTDENGEPYGVGPFTLREVIVAGLALLLLIASFLPLIGGEYAEFVGYSNLWGPAPWLAVPGVLVFLASAALLILRRTVPKVAWRVGSLSVDQFASAAAIVTAGFHLGAIFLMLGLGVWFGGANEGFAPGAGPILGLIVSLASIAATTLAVFIPPFAADFRDRPEAPAHRLARAARPVPQRPKPAPQAEQPWQSGDANTVAAYAAPGATSGGTGPIGPNMDGNAPVPSEPWPGAVSPTAPSGMAPSDARAAEEPPRTAAYAYRPHEAAPAEAEPTWSTPGTPDVAVEPETRRPAGSPDDEPRVDGPVVEFVPAEPEPSSSAAQAVTTDVAPGGETSAAEPVNEPVSEPEPQPELVSAPVAFAPFWVLAPEQRPVVDLSTGAPVFEVGPTAWSLAVGERDGGLVIRADDGRVGLLRAVDGLTRG